MDLTKYREAKARYDVAQTTFKEALAVFRKRWENQEQNLRMRHHLDILEANYQKERQAVEAQALAIFEVEKTKTIEAEGGKVTVVQSTQPDIVDEAGLIAQIGSSYPSLLPKLTKVKIAPFKKWWKAQVELGVAVAGVEPTEKTSVRIALD